MNCLRLPCRGSHSSEVRGFFLLGSWAGSSSSSSAGAPRCTTWNSCHANRSSVCSTWRTPWTSTLCSTGVPGTLGRSSVTTGRCPNTPWSPGQSGHVPSKQARSHSSHGVLVCRGWPVWASWSSSSRWGRRFGLHMVAVSMSSGRACRSFSAPVRSSTMPSAAHHWARALWARATVRSCAKQILQQHFSVLLFFMQGHLPISRSVRADSLHLPSVACWNLAWRGCGVAWLPAPLNMATISSHEAVDLSGGCISSSSSPSTSTTILVAAARPLLLPGSQTSWTNSRMMARPASSMASLRRALLGRTKVRGPLWPRAMLAWMACPLSSRSCLRPSSRRTPRPRPSKKSDPNGSSNPPNRPSCTRAPSTHISMRRCPHQSRCTPTPAAAGHPCPCPFVLCQTHTSPHQSTPRQIVICTSIQRSCSSHAALAVLYSMYTNPSTCPAHS